jgi:NADH-quinone oxidoreductase subunit G
MSDTVESAAPAKTTVSITIDGQAHEAQPGQLVIDACQDAGVYVPRFCYHPRMTPVGMCRQCLVEVEGPRGPMMVVSCMTNVAPDQVVRTDTDQVKRAQEGVLELLLANHPLDCPVCDKGGECPLQDQAFSHGPGESRYVEEKRHYEKPIPISELVYLDRERCILCDRCTRFASEVAGDPLISFTSRGNNTQVNTFPDEPFASYYSGNTVQICPVGALTAKPYRFKARPWDLDQTESTCTTCAVGCRTVVQSSRDEVLRYQGVDNNEVNWGWLCDKGRFGFEATNSDARLGAPALRTASGFSSVSWNEALDRAASMINAALADGGPGSIGIIGGARGTNEDAYVLARLAHDVIGTPNVYCQLYDALSKDILGLPRATINEAANARTIIVLGPDLKEELPVLHLRLRDAAEKRRSRILEFGSKSTGLTPLAWRSVTYRPGEQAEAVRRTLTEPEVMAQLASGPVVVVVGKANLAESHDLNTDALVDILAAAPGAKVLPAYRRGNVVGALQLGLVPAQGGKYSGTMLADAAAGRLKCLVLVGVDLVSDFPDAQLVEAALSAGVPTIAIDTFLSPTAQRADVVLAAAGAGEKDGTVTNLEGRVQTVARKVTPTGTARPDWMILADLAARLGHDLGFATVHDVTEAIAANVAAYADITPAALKASRDGLVAAVASAGPLTRKNVDVPVGSGYDYRLVVTRELYDLGINTQMSPSLAGLARGTRVHLHPVDAERLGVRTGSSVRLSTERGSLTVDVVVDDGVVRWTAWVPFNQPGGNVSSLLDSTRLVTDARIETV